jgi:long-chain fatty acid transport protein
LSKAASKKDSGSGGRAGWHFPGGLAVKANFLADGRRPVNLRCGSSVSFTKLMAKHPTIPLTALALGLMPLAALGNGLRLPSQDAFATARGEAFVATADNPSAIYYNPAGLTQLNGNNLRAGLYALYYDPTYQPPASANNAGNTYHVKNQYAFAPQLFISSRLLETPVSFGLGVYAPYGGAISWPSGTGFRTVGTQSSLTYIRVNPVVAVKLGDGFSFGAGLMVDYANIDLEQGLRPNSTFVNYFHFNGDGYSVGYNAGLLWQPVEKISVGATFRSQTSFTMNGNTSMAQFPTIPSTSLPASMDLTFPLTAVAGLSYRPTPRWNLEFDADYTDWSSFGKTSIKQQGVPPYPVRQNIPVKFGWQASWMYELGATRYFDNGWHASAGYIFNQTSVPNTYYSPLVADVDRHIFSLGAGRDGKLFDFDITYQVGYGPEHSVTGSSAPSTPGFSSSERANGVYAFFSQAVMVAVGVHF